MTRVLVLFGGKSAEHEVSCVSAVSTIDALSAGGHQVIPVGIDRTGGWHVADATRRPLEAAGPAAHLEVPTGVLMSRSGAVPFDVAFPVLHGPHGEDGTMQGLFEVIGVPYVGSGVLGSAVAMDKDVAKRLVSHAGIPCVPHMVVRAPEFEDDPHRVIDALMVEIGYPMFAKPAELGSSVGIGRAHDDASLKDALQAALEHGKKVVVEPEIQGREIEVAVLEGPRTSVPGEIIVDGWYTYDAKYADDATRLEVPATLSESEAATVRDLAGRAFTALECRGLARVDFFFEEGGRGFLLNELNTMPGFTPKSMFPMMWEATGVGYAELCDELVMLALAGGLRA